MLQICNIRTLRVYVKCCRSATFGLKGLRLVLLNSQLVAYYRKGGTLPAYGLLCKVQLLVGYELTMKRVGEERGVRCLLKVVYA